MSVHIVEIPHRDLFVRLFGPNAYVVGGHVRDLLMGRVSKDFDILIAGLPLEEIAERLRLHGRLDLVGRSFGVVKFTTSEGVESPITYDVALPRTDYVSDSKTRDHRGFVVRADPSLPVTADLERRDFTINSMAMRISDGELIDPLGGAQDIQRRLIRITNPATFTDDPLRVVRLARFASTLSFAVDPGLYEMCKEVDLIGLSVERIADEMTKMILRSPRPGVGFQQLLKVGALKQLFPELYAMALCIQDAVFHPEADEYGHHTVFHHTLLVMDQAQRLSDLFDLDAPRRMVMGLSALLHDVAKPQTTAWEYKHGRLCLTSAKHDVLGAQMAEQFLKRFRVFSYEGIDVQQLVCSIVRAHLRPLELWANRDSVTKKAFARLATDVDGETDLLVLFDQADRAGRREELIEKLDDIAAWLMATFREYKISRETLRPVVHGRDLLEIGFLPGPEMGRVLKELHGMQIDGVFETREQGVELARGVSLRLFGREVC
ncbi:MAG: CCA tRNA nucleotidyltransferase [Acidobacteria bacterium]|nr:CCA tRNA nucleotidyltransferase [Acidobacteriota bacterium]